MDVIAVKTINGKEYKQRFNQNAWNLLGPEKNGYVEIGGEQVIENKISKPSTGQRIENILKKPVEQVVEPAKKDPPPAQAPSQNDDKKKEDFFAHIEGFGKGTIKDFFDEEDPAVSYSNKSSLADLKKQLGEYLKFDILKLQAKFEK